MLASWERWEFASHALGMPDEKSGCTRGKHTGRLDDAVAAMNQKNGFAAMVGRGLGHSPRSMSQSSVPTAAGSPASQLACQAAQGLSS